MSIGLVIVLLVVFAVILLRSGAALWGLLAFALAFGLFCTTPAGDGTPAAVLDFLQGVGETTEPVLQGAGR